MEINPEDLLITQPFRGFLSGSSGSGKSSFILRFLQNRSQLCKESFDRVIYCSPNHFENLSDKDRQFFLDLRKSVPFVEIVSEIPDISLLQKSESKCTLLILEDLISEIIASGSISQLYTSISAHSNVSILTTTQNYFEQGKYAKTILRNQTFQVLFNSRTDNYTITNVSRQLFPRNRDFLRNCFTWLNEHVSAHYKRYLFIDCSNHTELPLTFPQVRTNMFKECNFFSPLFFKPK